MQRYSMLVHEHDQFRVEVDFSEKMDAIDVIDGKGFLLAARIFKFYGIFVSANPPAFKYVIITQKDSLLLVRLSPA